MGKLRGKQIILCAAVFFVAFIPVNAKSNTLSARAETACEDFGLAYGIQPELIEAVVLVESGGDKYATNKSCKGLMQISERWHQDRMKKLGVTDIYDERDNIKVGTDYLAELFVEYEDPCLVLDLYNGNAKAFEYYEAGVVSEYANKVLTLSAELEREHGK